MKIVVHALLILSHRHRKISRNPSVLSKLGSTLPHGLKTPLCTVNPMHEGFSVSGAPFFRFGLADPARPRPRGRGRPVFADPWRLPYAS